MTYISTRSGTVDFLNPTPDSILIEDIAHALSLTNRYSGHTPWPYSVAQHCVLASDVAPTGLELEALLHDAQEAYVGDMPTPLKALLPDYKVIEDRLEAVIRAKFGLPEEFTSALKAVDHRLMITEAAEFGFDLWVPTSGMVPYPDLPIEPWHWRTARARFLAQFDRLTR
jgi:hypothetical protein